MKYNDPGDSEGYLPDFCIIPINTKYYSDSIAIIPIMGYILKEA